MDRSDLAKKFIEIGNQTWKTFVLEAHPQVSPGAFLRDIFGPESVRDTDDVQLYELLVDEVTYAVDTLDDRFWSFHTTDTVDRVRRPLYAAINRCNDLDHVWLPSAHLRAIERHGRTKWVRTEFRAKDFLPMESVQDLSFSAQGGASQALLDEFSKLPHYTYALSLHRVGLLAYDESFGTIEEAVSRKAVFVARGQSFPLHQQVVAGTIERYRRLVEAAETLALGFDPLHAVDDNHSEVNGGGGRLVGCPIELTFSHPLPDLRGFLEGLLSSRAPFRLWGVVDDYTDEYAEVEAVDLHVGSRIRLEISPKMMRVHLRRGGCGNTIARLVSNLQHHVDGSISATEPLIQSRLDLNAA